MVRESDVVKRLFFVRVVDGELTAAWKDDVCDVCGYIVSEFVFCVFSVQSVAYCRDVIRGGHVGRLAVDRAVEYEDFWTLASRDCFTNFSQD